MLTVGIPSLLSPIGILHKNHIAFVGVSKLDMSALRTTNGALDDLFGHELTVGVKLRRNLYCFPLGMFSI
jgi:hypothetical protein